MTTRPLSLGRISRPASLILLAWMVVCTCYNHYFLNFEWDVAATDSLVGLVLLAIGCVSVSNLLAYYQPKNEKILYILVLDLILTAVVVYPAVYGLQYLFADNAGYLTYLKMSIPMRMVICFFTIGWCSLANILWYRLDEQTEMQDRLLAAQNLAKEAELNKLRHQLQPHFLFNSLNSVYALTIVNPTEAGTMITKLASFLRGTLKRDDEVWVKVEEEMEYIQLYLDIEKVRFSHRLTIQIDIQEEALERCLPGTFLQPIVENAIKFGLYNTSAKITISISVKVENNVLLIRVENPYDPDARAGGGTGFGLSAIRRRLYLLFADSSLLSTESQNDSLYITTLKIPQINDKNHPDR